MQRKEPSKPLPKATNAIIHSAVANGATFRAEPERALKSGKKSFKTVKIAIAAASQASAVNTAAN
jgi:hypothetical protein